MTALTQDLSIDSEIAHVDVPLVAGEAYTIGDEVIRASHALIEEWDDVAGAGSGLRWFIERGEDHTTPAAHSSGATLTLARKYGGGGEAGEQTVYVQPDDPGAVGVGKLWVDTTDPALFAVRRRNPDDDAWWELFDSYVAAGPIDVETRGELVRLRRRSADGSVIRNELVMDPGDTRLRAMDEAGTIIAEWEVSTDGMGALVNDELQTSRVILESTAGASGDTDARYSVTVYDAASVEKAKILWDQTGLHFGGVVPEVPASPTEQDIVDALLALGLVTQAAP